MHRRNEERQFGYLCQHAGAREMTAFGQQEPVVGCATLSFGLY